MSLQAITWAMKQQTGGATRKLVLLLLADFHNDKTSRCDPSITLMAQRAECSERTIRYALKQLVEAGFISRQQRSGTSTQYVLAMDTPARFAPLRDLHPCTTCTPPLQDLQGTPATVAPKPALNRKEPALRESTPRKRGSRLPEDWRAGEELLDWARQQRPDLDVTVEEEKFRDYWLAKTGQNATKRDWSRTFKNWIRNARAPYRSAGGGTGDENYI